MSEKSTENKILSYLKDKKEQKILDISSNLNLDRHTTAKYLEILKTKGLTNYKSKGKAKLWSLTNNQFTELIGKTDFISNQILNVLSLLEYEVSIQSKEHDIIWHNHSKKTGKCYQILQGKKTRCKNCLSNEVFKTGQTQKITTKNQEKETTKIFQPIKNDTGEVMAVIEIIRKTK